MFDALFILLLATLFGYIFSDYVIRKKAKRWHHIGIKKGYHIHHSTYGLVMFIIASPTAASSHITAALSITGFGLGIILEHTRNERFVFVEKLHSFEKSLEERFA